MIDLIDATKTKEGKEETEIMSGTEIEIDTMREIVIVVETTKEAVKEDTNAKDQEAETRKKTMTDTETRRFRRQTITDKSPSSCCRRRKSR